MRKVDLPDCKISHEQLIGPVANFQESCHSSFKLDATESSRWMVKMSLITYRALATLANVVLL